MIQEFGWPKVLGQQCKHAKKEKKMKVTVNQ
jgi:hypothetical protein